MAKRVISGRSHSMALGQPGKGKTGIKRQSTEGDKLSFGKRASVDISKRADLLASHVAAALTSASSAFVTPAESCATFGDVKLRETAPKANNSAVSNPHLGTLKAEHLNSSNAIGSSTPKVRRPAKKKCKSGSTTAKAQRCEVKAVPSSTTDLVVGKKRRGTKEHHMEYKKDQSCTKAIQRGNPKVKRNPTTVDGVMCSSSVDQNDQNGQEALDASIAVTKRDSVQRIKQKTPRMSKLTKPENEHLKHRSIQSSKSSTAMHVLKNRPSWNSSTVSCSPYKLTCRTTTVTLDSKVANKFKCQRSKSDHSKVLINEPSEMQTPASYSPLSSLNKSSSKLDKSDSKPRLRKNNHTGVIRTRIVRKIKAFSSVNCSASKINKNGSHKLTVNPCDDGNMKKSKLLPKESKDRSNGDSSEARNANNIEFPNSTSEQFSLASCPELRKSSATAGAATSLSDYKTYSRRVLSTHTSGNSGCSRNHVHVTRIRRRPRQQPPRDSNNNADDEAEDSTEAKPEKTPVKTPETKSSSSESESLSKESPVTQLQSSETIETVDEKESSESTLPETVSKKKMSIKEETVEKEKKVKKKKVTKKRASVNKEYKEVPKATQPPCPLFGGWDFDGKIASHYMKNLPSECDLAAQLSKRAKVKVWEAIGRPMNITSWVRVSEASPSAPVDDNLKTYLAKHSIEEFVQHLTNSVLLAPEDESVIGTLIEQGQLFKQRLKYDTDTNDFLQFVFSKLGNKPIAFPSATKTQNVDIDYADYDSVSETPMDRHSSIKRSIDIVIGMPGVIYEPRLSARLDFEKRNTLQPHDSLFRKPSQ